MPYKNFYNTLQKNNQKNLQKFNKKKPAKHLRQKVYYILWDIYLCCVQI